jgi:hypothetical protein
VGKLLKKIANDTKSQVDFGKICKSPLHSGIIVDYWIPSLQCVVEVHGVQHYKPSGFGRNKVDTNIAFNRQINRDDKLKNLCIQYKLNYIEIPFNEDVNYAGLFSTLMPFMEDDNE